MGIMETALHSESRGAVSSVNGSHSEGSLGKLSIKNGDCSYLAAPKYSRWGISVVRDFPPGCGRYAREINLREKEDAACIVSLDNLVGGHKDGLKLMEVEHEGEHEGLHNVGLDEHLKVVRCETPILKLCSSPERSFDISCENYLEETINNNHLLRRRVSAIRTFPPFCGWNAPRISKEEIQIVINSLKSKSLGQEKSGSVDNSLKETIKPHVEQTRDYMKDIDVHENNLEGIVSRLAQAHCERHASKAARKKDKLATSSEVKFLQYHEKEKMIKATHESDQYSKSQTIYNKSDNDVGHSKKSVWKETVIYRKKKKVPTATLR